MTRATKRGVVTLRSQAGGLVALVSQPCGDATRTAIIGRGAAHWSLEGGAIVDQYMRGRRRVVGQIRARMAAMSKSIRRQPREPAAEQRGVDPIDVAMMKRCIELSRTARAHGELPFACLIRQDADVIVEATNRVARDADITRHAELVAVSEAQRVLGRIRLTRCTLYTIVEPCPMCSFPIRESGIGRVVYALGSPLMGGSSKWDVLGDQEVSRIMPEYFRGPPQVVAGVLAEEAERAWHDWNPLIWAIMKRRGCFR